MVIKCKMSSEYGNMLDFDLSFLPSSSNSSEQLQNKLDKQTKALLIAKKRTIGTDNLLRKYYGSKEVLEQTRRNLLESQEECKQICIGRSVLQQRLTNLEEEIKRCHAARKELEEKCFLAENRCVGIQTHANQLESLAQEITKGKFELKQTNVLQKTNIENLEKKIHKILKEKETILKHIHIFCEIAAGKRKLDRSSRSILKKYGDFSETKCSKDIPFEDYCSNDDGVADNSDWIDESMDSCSEISKMNKEDVEPVITVSGDKKIEQVIKYNDINLNNYDIGKRHAKSIDTDRDSDCELPHSIDTGRGSSLAFSDSEKCFQSPDYCMTDTDSPLSRDDIQIKCKLDAATSPFRFFASEDRATSPMNIENETTATLVDKAINTDNEEVFRKPNEVAASNVTSNEIKPNLNIEKSATISEIDTIPEKSQDLTGTCKINISCPSPTYSCNKPIIIEKELIKNRQNTRDHIDVTSILRSMSLDYDMMAPLSPSPSITSRDHEPCPEAAKYKEETNKLKQEQEKLKNDMEALYKRIANLEKLYTLNISHNAGKVAVDDDEKLSKNCKVDQDFSDTFSKRYDGEIDQDVVKTDGSYTFTKSQGASEVAISTPDAMAAIEPTKTNPWTDISLTSSKFANSSPIKEINGDKVRVSIFEPLLENSCTGNTKPTIKESETAIEISSSIDIDEARITHMCVNNIDPDIYVSQSPERIAFRNTDCTNKRIASPTFKASKNTDTIMSVEPMITISCTDSEKNTYDNVEIHRPVKNTIRNKKTIDSYSCKENTSGSVVNNINSNIKEFMSPIVKATEANNILLRKKSTVDNGVNESDSDLIRIEANLEADLPEDRELLSIQSKKRRAKDHRVEIIIDKDVNESNSSKLISENRSRVTEKSIGELLDEPALKDSHDITVLSIGTNEIDNHVKPRQKRSKVTKLQILKNKLKPKGKIKSDNPISKRQKMILAKYPTVSLNRLNRSPDYKEAYEKALAVFANLRENRTNENTNKNYFKPQDKGPVINMNFETESIPEASPKSKGDRRNVISRVMSESPPTRLITTRSRTRSIRNSISDEVDVRLSLDSNTTPSRSRSYRSLFSDDDQIQVSVDSIQSNKEHFESNTCGEPRFKSSQKRKLFELADTPRRKLRSTGKLLDNYTQNDIDIKNSPTTRKRSKEENNNRRLSLESEKTKSQADSDALTDAIVIIETSPKVVKAIKRLEENQSAYNNIMSESTNESRIIKNETASANIKQSPEVSKANKFSEASNSVINNKKAICEKGESHTEITSYADLDLFNETTPLIPVEAINHEDNHLTIGTEPNCIRSHKDGIICRMVDKYGVKKVARFGKQVSDKIKDNICEKLEEHMSKICEMPDEEAKPAMDKLVKYVKSLKFKHFLCSLVKFFKEPVRNMELKSKCFAPPAPPMTKREQIMLYIIIKIKSSMPDVDVMDNIFNMFEYTLFRLNHTPDYCAIESMSHFYAILCRYTKSKNRLRLFLLDAMYCLSYKAIPLIRQCISVWMLILPLAHLRTAKSPLVICLVYLLHFYKCEKDYSRNVELLRTELKKKYSYEMYEWNEKKILEFFRNAIVELADIPIEKKMLRISLILLAKRHGAKWTNKIIVKTLLLPLIENSNVSEYVHAFCISMLGPLLRPFPTEMKVDCEIIVNQLNDMLDQRRSHQIQEAIYTSLVFLSRHNQNRIIKALLEWKPDSVSLDLEHLLRDYVREKPINFWTSKLGQIANCTLN